MTQKTTNILQVILLSVLLLLHPGFVDQVRGEWWNVQDQPSCRQLLDQAEDLYYNSEFDEAIRIVRECLKIRSIDKPQLVRAYTLLARIYLVSDDKVAAEDNITQILNLSPSYSPTIEEETPKYVNLVAEVRQNVGRTQIAANETPSDSSGISPWVWIGAGGAAVITIIAVVSSNNGGNSQTVQDKALPEPPGYPQ